MATCDVELTPDELAEAIAGAKLKKQEQQRESEKIERIRQFEHELRRPWTPEELWEFVADRHINDFKFEIKIDDENRALIQMLCYYFSDHPDFEQMGKGFSLNKGLLLMGGIGVGKTTLLRAFSLNKKQSYLITSCRQCAGMYQKDGADVLSKFAQPFFPPGNDQRFFYQKKIGRCFDDLGTECTKKNFGNEANVMSEIIQNQYDAKGKFPFNLWHMTTNLTAIEIEATYGSRERSRMREMFNVIKISGNDRRKTV